MTIRTWDQAEQALADRWGSFQPRPQQRKLAGAVAQTISGNDNHRVLLAQAGCGVGKSLGYLIPAVASGKRVVVSVSTKALQDQLVHKDLPVLRDTLFPDLTFASLKGRTNYVCLRAADKAGQPAGVEPGSAGERSDLLVPVSDQDWRGITVDAEGCVGRKKCPFSAECYSEAAKDRALAARVLVVNTSLLTQDLRFRAMTRGKANLLGEIGVLVVDEAHEMADIVTSGLSIQMTAHRVLDATSRLVYHLEAEDTPALVEKINSEVSRYFRSCESWFDQNRAERTADLAEDDHRALMRLYDQLRPLAGRVSRAECQCDPVMDEETGEEDLVCEFARRIGSLMTDLAGFADPSGTTDVVWMETTRSGSVVLKRSPAEVGGFLKTALWAPDFDDPRPAILASATLDVGGDFSYTARRLGVPEYTDLDVGTPFDFDRQARLYLPPAGSPNPTRQKAEWKVWAQDQMLELVRAADGGALLLFTSVEAMREARGQMRSELERGLGIRTLMQGDGIDNRQLAQQFADDRHSVLFATRSFMTGVDFAGDACRLVVVDKMPFPVPTEPVFRARCRAVDERFGNKASFRRVSLPEMSLVLRQAFGRLIRTVDDFGVVAILDGRMRAGWAVSVRNSLPPAPVVDSIEQVSQFYRGLKIAV